MRKHEHGRPGGAEHEAAPVRTGLSAGAVLTGTFVAFGVMFVLSALASGLVGVTGIEDLSRTQVVQIGVGAGAVFVVGQLLAYLWGGYTAGRMARGTGIGHGLLVPVASLVIAAVVGSVGRWLGADGWINVLFSPARLPVEQDAVIDFGIGVGLAMLAAMFAGGLMGGILGARWHHKLKSRELDPEAEISARAPRPVDDQTLRGPRPEEPRGRG